MRRRIVALTALILPLAAAFTLVRTRRAAREDELRSATHDAVDALALVEGCLLGGGERPARRDLLETRVRRLALGDHGASPWPARCAPHLDPLARIERGAGGVGALRSVARSAEALRTSLGSAEVRDDVARFRAGEGGLAAPWRGPMDALRGAVASLARSRGVSLKTPSSQFAPRPLPSLAVETLPLSLGAGATLVGTRSDAGVFIAAWQDGDQRVACRSADQGVSVRCGRGGAGGEFDPVFVDNRGVRAFVRGGVLRVRDAAGELHALTDDRAHGGIEAREAWVIPMGARVLLVVAGEGVSMFWSDDGGRRWHATREGA